MNKKLIFFVAGLGRFGESVATTLENMGYEVMAMDLDEDVVQNLSSTLGYVVCADASEEKNLQAIGAGNADVAVVALGDMSASLLSTLILKEMGVKKIVVKALSKMHGKMLTKIGADKIIYSEHEMGIRVAHNLVNPGLVDYIEMDNDLSVFSIRVPSGWVGKDLKNLNVRNKYNITVVAICRGEKTMVNPNPELKLQVDDMMIILGDNESVKKVTETIGNS